MESHSVTQYSVLGIQLSNIARTPSETNSLADPPYSALHNCVNTRLRKKLFVRVYCDHRSRFEIDLPARDPHAYICR